jgi:hypothetical protein
LNNSSSVTFAGGGQTFSSVYFPNTTNSIAISGANTFVSVTFSRATTGITPVTFSANQTITSDITFNGGSAVARLFLKSDVLGTTRTLNISTIPLNTDTDFQDIAITGAAAPASGTRLGDCKGNSGITFGAGVNKYWNGAGGGNWSVAAWATTSGGAPSVNNFPLAQDTAIFQSTNLNSGATVTINLGWNIGTIDMSARTSNTMTLATGTTTPIIYGNWINGTGTTITGTGQIQFSGRGAQSITSAGVTFTQPFQFDSPGGTITLQDAFTTSSTTSGTIKQNNGTVDLNGKTLTVSNTGASTAWQIGTGTKNLTFNGGTLVIAASGGTAFNNAAPTGFTTTAGTGTGTISLTSASAKGFVGANSTYNCTINQGGAGALSISGSNTFSNITNTYSATGATTITFTASTTTTFANWKATGTVGNVLTINSSSAGVAYTLAKSGGGFISGVDYINYRDAIGSPLSDTWYMGANSAYSTTTPNRTQGLYSTTRALNAVVVLTSGTSWVVPSDWNNSANTIHLFGAGGGGAGGYATSPNYAGGGGGGGGGYTKLTNQTLSGTITYAIGTAGTGGTGGNNGNAGGTTSWNSGTSTAGGGKGGTASLAPASAGGVGGVGATFNGGDGGAGAISTTASSYAGGGGGGGAGGVNGVGGTGGLGFSTTNSSLTSAGGGGGNGGGSAGGAGLSGSYGPGGNNSSGIGGGTSTTPGTLGGGSASGRGGAGPAGLSGGNEIYGGIGGAGGMGGTVNAATATPNLYGGGGHGGGGYLTSSTAPGGAGGAGLIVIVYTPSGAVVNTGKFFNFFPM